MSSSEKRKRSNTSRKRASSLTKKVLYEVVYDEPTDALKPAPFRSSRPKLQGDIVADIMFYGDSLTWGHCHSKRGRYETPWPRHLKEKLLSKGLRLVESSFQHRTTCFDDESLENEDDGFKANDYNGLYHFGTVFSSHSPRWVVILLGTFDLKENIRNLYKNGCTAEKVAQNCMKLAEKAREMFEGHCHEGQLKILFVPPPVVKLTKGSRKLGFDNESVSISKGFKSAFQKVCIQNDVLFVNHEISMKGSSDGIHITENEGKKLAEAVWNTMLHELPRRTKRPDRYGPL